MEKSGPKFLMKVQKKEIDIARVINNVFNSTEFSFSFVCYDASYYNGTYVCTFTIGGKSYYTEERSFSFGEV